MKLKIVTISFLLSIVSTNYAVKVKLPNVDDLHDRLCKKFPRIPEKRNTIVDDLADKEMHPLSVLMCVEKVLKNGFGPMALDVDEKRKMDILSQQFTKEILQGSEAALAELRYLGLLKDV